MEGIIAFILGLIFIGLPCALMVALIRYLWRKGNKH